MLDGATFCQLYFLFFICANTATLKDSVRRLSSMSFSGPLDGAITLLQSAFMSSRSTAARLSKTVSCSLAICGC